LEHASENVLIALVDLLQDEEDSTRSLAASALGSLGNSHKEVVNALLDSLEDNNSRTRLCAASALGELGYATDKVFSCFVELLKNEEYLIRIDAGVAAKELCQNSEISEQLLNTLVELCKDESRHVQMGAASALAESKQALDIVINALLDMLNKEDFDFFVRLSAVSALVKLGHISENVIYHVLSLLEKYSILSSTVVRESSGQVTPNPYRAVYYGGREDLMQCLTQCASKSPLFLQKLTQWLEQQPSNVEIGIAIEALERAVEGTT
jgi:HEAT repeat protein